MLLCTVRDCCSPLRRDERRFVCERGHSFDIARSGYVNLLQPQERRSRQPGDSAEAVKARRRLHDLGVTAPMLAGIRESIEATKDDVLVDAGCGDGFYLGGLQQGAECRALGVDISTPAVDAAARRYPACEWVVANADRFLPCADASVSHVVSITGRRNAGEFRRVLREGGVLLVAVPAPDDLIELRGKGKDRAESVLAEFAAEFSMERQSRVTTVAELSEEAVGDLLVSIYRPLGAKPVGAMRVTFSLDVFRFVPKVAGQVVSPLQGSGE